MEALAIVRRLDQDGKLNEAPELQKQDFALRVSRILWASQPLSHCTDSAPDETCVTCFSPWTHCWVLTHPLQWSLYGTKISR